MPEDDDKLSDEALFKAHVGPVQPIKSKPRINPARKKPSPQIKTRTEQPPKARDLGADIEPAGMLDSLFYAQPGLQPKSIKRLKQGRLAIDEILDLHGLDQTAAEQTMLDFLEHSVNRHHRCILVIHGKGMHGEERWPILKNLTQTVLRRHTQVLAFSSAQVRDGGLGAVYVLLKR